MKLPKGLERVGSCWFQNSGIEVVVVPASVREIGSYAFDGCEKLNSVIFAEGSGLEALSDFAFHKCPSLKCIELPSTTRRIGGWCFSESGLETFTVPEAVTEFGEGVFYKCMSLTRVTMSDG